VVNASLADWELYRYAKDRFVQFEHAHIPDAQERLESFLHTYGSTECTKGTLEAEKTGSHHESH
jgi:hypothetical protein